MGKKNKGNNKNEKKTAEFILTARPADDPDYQNPNVPQNILLYKPTDKDDENTQKTLDNIPESIRGNTFDEETQDKLVKQRLGIEDNLDQSGAFGAQNQNSNTKNAKKKPKSDYVPVLFNEDANKDLTESEEEVEDVDLEEDEEIIDTKIRNNKKDNNNNNKDAKKPIGFKSEKAAAAAKKEPVKLTLKELLSSGNKELLLNIDDKTLDMLIKNSNAKIDAEIIHYNEYGLKNSVDPEVLEYVTDKKFREGVDLFIPAPNYHEIMEQNRVDIDINPEEMNAEYKEVYEALVNNNQKFDDEGEDGDNSFLEDDFILLANEGKLPIELLETQSFNDQSHKNINKANNKDEILLAASKVSNNSNKQPKEPSYKFITKEEKEFLDKQFSKTYEQFYQDGAADEEALSAPKGNKGKNDAKFAAVEEEEFEEYEELSGEVKEDQEESKKNQSKKTYLNSQEFNEAINEMLPKHKRITNNNNNDAAGKACDDDEEEEFEDFDENLLDDQYIREQQELGEMESSLKYSENLVLEEKGGAAKRLLKANIGSDKGKIVEKGNLVLKTKKKIEDEETIEDIEKYLYSKEVIEIDLKVINNMLLRDEMNKDADIVKEETDPAYELNYAKKYLDITSVAGTFGNMPKVIAIEGDPKKHERKLRKEEKIKKEKEAKLAEKSQEANNNIKAKNNVISSLINININNKERDFNFNKEIKVNNNIHINDINDHGLLSDKINKTDFTVDSELKGKLEHLDLVNSDIEEDNSDKDQEDVDFNELEEKHKFENLGEKEANKLRKKMLKSEKKEKRKLKKEIKTAFKVI